MTDNVNVYGEAMWAKTHSFNPDIVRYFNLGSITVNSGNPFIPAGIQSAMNAQGITSLTMGSTAQDLGLLQGENTRTTKRYVVGANGSFDSDAYRDELTATAGKPTRRAIRRRLLMAGLLIRERQ